VIHTNPTDESPYVSITPGRLIAGKNPLFFNQLRHLPDQRLTEAQAHHDPFCHFFGLRLLIQGCPSVHAAKKSRQS